MEMRIRLGIAIALLLAALPAAAKDPVDCRLTTSDGKIEVKGVASPQECRRRGGELVRPIYCQLNRTRKQEVKQVATAQDCSRLDGKIVRKAEHPRGSRSQQPID
jgi:hypothetical protein